MNFVRIHYKKQDISGVHLTYLYHTLCAQSSNFNAKTYAYIIAELAASVDVSHPIREATYFLEGDGPLSLIAIEIITRAWTILSDCVPTMDFANCRSVIAENVAANIFPDEFGAPYTIEGAWIEYMKGTTKRAVDYFKEEVVGHSSNLYMHAAAMANPDFMRVLQPSAASLRAALEPLVGKLISSAHVDNMVQEMADYKQVASAINWRDEKVKDKLTLIIDFWKTSHGLQYWQQFAHLCYLLQVSSASVERAFSLLKYIYGEQQTTSKQDIIESILMLRYNRRAA